MKMCRFVFRGELYGWSGHAIRASVR
jgi:hypothetical protein